MTLSIGLTGDVMLGRKVDERRRHDPPATVWGDVLSRLQSLDGLFINLECTLSTRGRPWRRTYRPFHFRADPSWAVPALETAGVDWACLANNHLLDFEEVALLDTIESLDIAGISHAGAGADESNAMNPSIVSIGDLDVGLLALTDNTPEYAAGPGSPGIARVEMDLSEGERETILGLLERIQSAGPDLVVASLHWGPNMVAYPAEQYRRFGRWLIDHGVDVVHGHSAHVFQGIERYGGGLICYDCGDFVDDYAVDQDLRNDRSFLFELRVSEVGSLEELVLHPTETDLATVEEASSEVAAWCRETMRERSEPFGTAWVFERRDTGLRLPL